MILLILSLFANQITTVQADDEILCERAPTAYLVGESALASNSGNPCSGTAKIQAIAYECGDTMNTYTTTQRFFKENLKKAKAECQKFCESLGPKCSGRLAEQTSCGFSLPTNRALDTGMNVVHCPKHCKGRAFNYCSLIHSNFFSTDKELFKDKPMNCFCQKKN